MKMLETRELLDLISRVFPPIEGDQTIMILIDLPDEGCPDDPAWRIRRDMAGEWAEALRCGREESGLDTILVAYPNVGRNNADLPNLGWPIRTPLVPGHTSGLMISDARPMEDLLASASIILAPTRFSATAPLKVAARRLGFRAATMPGFVPEMIPALRLDYGLINRRCLGLKRLVDACLEARFVFVVDGAREYDLLLDLRHRTGHASGGVFPEPGVAGNLPSGETYIVPYEGERPGDPSRSRGRLPVQLGTDVVIYDIEANRAVSVSGEEPTATREAEYLAREPAYGNLAELGLGVLSDFGLKPLGEILLDEKLGLHIAFGRSDHFGGRVGPADFSGPAAVVHIDRVYLPETQPRILVKAVDLTDDRGEVTELIRDGLYALDFDTLV